VSDSKRQQIIDKVKARMQTITTANGYKTDAGQHVFTWLSRVLADSELDAIDIRDKTCPQEQSSLSLYTNKLRVEFEAKTKAASITDEAAREILDDIYKAIGVDDTWDGLAENTEPIENNMDIQQSDKIAGAATIVVEIEYTTEKWSF
jgi:hypothetical protein